MSDGKVYYGSYLQLDKILGAQALESAKSDVKAHDEMLFIIIHQAYELWFKQILHELDSVVKIFKHPEINDDSPSVPTTVHRLRRVNTIIQVLVQQIDILETMTPLDFLDFRDLLRPASGFQSIQWKEIEARLGLKMEQRFGREYYTSQLQPTDKEHIEKIEEKPTFIELLNAWLERMPFFKEAYWGKPDIDGRPAFWSAMRDSYKNSLNDREKGNLEEWDKTFFSEGGDRKLSASACRSALFIMLYRDLPLFQLPSAYSKPCLISMKAWQRGAIGISIW